MTHTQLNEYDNTTDIYLIEEMYYWLKDRKATYWSNPLDKERDTVKFFFGYHGWGNTYMPSRIQRRMFARLKHLIANDVDFTFESWVELELSNNPRISINGIEVKYLF